MPTIHEALDGAVVPETAPEPEAIVTEPTVEAEVGQGEAEGVAETSETTYFDPTEFADRKAKVKVAGEELEVPVPELVDGYMRQADYTRKTQELAQTRALQEALQRDPEGTIRELALRQLAAQAQQREQVEELPTDPVQREVYELRQQVQSLREMEEDRQLYRAFSQLQSKYGDEFNVEQVATRAHQQGTLDLEGVFLQLQGEKYWAAQAAIREDAAQRASADSAVNAAKSEASQLSGGRSALGGGAPLEDQDLSVAEAFEIAQQRHGRLTFG